MSEFTKKYLYDMLEAVRDLELIAASAKNYGDFEKDKMLRLASERLLTIVGEALNRARHSEPNLKIENISQIVGLRNRLVHAYDSIDLPTIWLILKRDLSPLKTQLETLLSNNND